MALPAHDVARVRFAVSPLWQLTTSYRLLASGAADPVHRRWLDQVRPRTAAAGLDRRLLAELLPPGAGYVPDFLNPAPATPAPTLDEELAALAATPAERIRADLDHLRHHQGRTGPRTRALHADPPAQLPRLVREIAAYWETVLAPYWPRIRALLDADVFHRAGQAARHGTGHLLNSLHPQVSWGDAGLHLERRARTLARHATGSGLLLVPSAFKGSGLSTRIAPPDPPQLAYRARGTGDLWQPRTAPAADALAAVLGRARTLLLAELDTPATTTELAARTGLSPAHVSQNLTALRAAGFATAHRTGRTVLYARTAVAETLLTEVPPTARPPTATPLTESPLTERPPPPAADSDRGRGGGPPRGQ
nr:ArsR family transcriptional regulator [Kitasatospora phosalacinea]